MRVLGILVTEGVDEVMVQLDVLAVLFDLFQVLLHERGLADYSVVRVETGTLFTSDRLAVETQVVDA